jgi:hypothetical protein
MPGLPKGLEGATGPDFEDPQSSCGLEGTNGEGSRVPSSTRAESILHFRLPELNRITFGVVQTSKPAIRIDLNIQVALDASNAELRHHRVEITNAEVNHRKSVLDSRNRASLQETE